MHGEEIMIIILMRANRHNSTVHRDPHSDAMQDNVQYYYGGSVAISRIVILMAVLNRYMDIP